MRKYLYCTVQFTLALAVSSPRGALFTCFVLPGSSSRWCFLGRHKCGTVILCSGRRGFAVIPGVRQSKGGPT
ncbi:hypothetical protein F5Y07DRAFT_371053 [Xylaria sp. FL0933]|nr:hypothetical protein F5Y07DRAFT_371053 [Xylaria sp. FL0933]